MPRTAPRRARCCAALLAAAAVFAPAAYSAASQAEARLAPPALMATGEASKPAITYNGVADTGQFLPDSAVLARVDDKRFTARTFVDEYFNASPGDRPGPDSLGRVKFLNALINKQVLGQAARKVGYNIGYEGRVEMRDYTQSLLSSELFHRLVIDSVKVTEEDLRQMYEQYKVAVHLQHILFRDRRTAEAVRGDLIAGRISWREAVKKYSHAASHGPDGDLGWVKRWDLSEAIANDVFATKVGQISKVVEDQDGFELLRAVEMRPVGPPSYETMRPLLRKQLVKYRVDLAAERVQAAVTSHMRFVPDTANIAWASRAFPAPITYEHPGAGGTDMNVDASIPAFSSTDTSRILARWKDGSLSLSRFLIEYGEIPPILRPAANTPEGMTAVVANIASEPYKAQMAIERGYDKDPAVVEQLDAHYEKLIVERMYSDSVDAHVQVTHADRQAEYDNHRKRYIAPEKRRYATIMRFSQVSADSLARALRAGANAETVLAADAARGLHTGLVHEMGADEHGPFKKVVFEELKPGQVTTMVGDSARVVVVQLLSVAPERQRSYEESQGEIDDSLRAEQSERLMQAWLARLKKGHRIESRPDLVMRLRFIDPLLQ